MVLESLDIENIKAKLPTDYLSGFFGILGSVATLKQVEVNLKTGETKDIKTTEIKTSAEMTEEQSQTLPILLNEYSYGEGDDHCKAVYHIIEVSGAILHPVNIEAVTNKMPYSTPRQNIEPAKNIVVKGMFRSATSSEVGETSDKNGVIHSVSGYFIRKFTVYLIDSLGYSIMAPPSNDTIIQTLKSNYRTSIPDYYNVRSFAGLKKYRL